jgi:hypothetical protein
MSKTNGFPQTRGLEPVTDKRELESVDGGVGRWVVKKVGEVIVTRIIERAIDEGKEAWDRHVQGSVDRFNSDPMRGAARRYRRGPSYFTR